MPWYEVLMVSPDATIEEVRDAYRRLIGQYHPDKVIRLGEEIRQLAVRKSQEINVAYETARRQMGQSA
jgi:DnaJ like chaperone protein